MKHMKSRGLFGALVTLLSQPVPKRDDGSVEDSPLDGVLWLIHMVMKNEASRSLMVGAGVLRPLYAVISGSSNNTRELALAVLALLVSDGSTTPPPYQHIPSSITPSIPHLSPPHLSLHPSPCSSTSSSLSRACALKFSPASSSVLQTKIILMLWCRVVLERLRKNQCHLLVLCVYFFRGASHTSGVQRTARPRYSNTTWRRASRATRRTLPILPAAASSLGDGSAASAPSVSPTRRGHTRLWTTPSVHKPWLLHINSGCSYSTSVDSYRAAIASGPGSKGEGRMNLHS
eukprot:TRINITY_DN4778_c0_g1_i3.p1 TRINITY_DN4778_c0_g1~~TRINITY_DN4778_c0_g1_i3.p1  ORF type:complete len:328 (+),score=30.75 TRINITY_DN4778_c0_g1_i3:119-985(+)